MDILSIEAQETIKLSSESIEQRNNMGKVIFIHILRWMYRKGVQFGVDHVTMGNKTYWMDTDSDLSELYQIYKDESD